MKVMVLGAGGQLGASLVNKLSLTGCAVLAFNKQQLDITNFIGTALEIESHRPDIIINAAAYTNVDRAESDRVIADAVNHLAVKNLARASRQCGALLVHLSTDYVFDGKASLPYEESDLAIPINIYGKTKAAAERAILEEAHKYIIIRTSWLFGGSGDNFFTKINYLLRSSKKLHVVDDQIGGPTYANHLVIFVEKLVSDYQLHRSLPYGIYHYAGYPFVSRYEFACYIKNSLVRNADCTIHPVVSSLYPSIASRPINSCLSTSKASSIFNVRPSDWREAINDIVSAKRLL